MCLLYQHDSSQEYICGELNNFDDKNLQLFCTGDLERSYAECHLGLLVCCSVVLVQIIKISIGFYIGSGTRGGSRTNTRNMKRLVYGDRQYSHKVNSKAC